MPFNCDNFLEVKDSIFIKGLRTNANIKSCDVRDYFQERVGECSVIVAPVSKDKKWLFVALKFKSATIAETVIERFDGKYIFGHRVMLSYWRAPRNKTHPGRPHQNPIESNSRNSRWENRDFKKDKTEVSARSRGNMEYSRDRSSENRKRKTRETVHYDEKDNSRDRHEHNFPGRYDTNENFGYQEDTENSVQEYQWDSDGAGGTYYDENMTDWDSDYNCGSENFSERDYYDRQEELPYHHKDAMWPEGEVDSEQAFTDRTGQRDCETKYSELDMNREFYYESHDGDLREDYVHNQCNYPKRSPEEIGYRNEDVGARKRSWYEAREHSKTQGIQNRSQGNLPSRFSPYDQTDQLWWWEAAAPGKPTRRRLSDPDVLHNRPSHISRGQDLADQRSSNNRRDLTSRTVDILPDERPRSDEWLRVSHRNVQDERQGRHSASPVNLRSKSSSRPGNLLVQIRNHFPEAHDNRSSLDRMHSNNFVGSAHGRRSNSPVREKSGSEYARHDTSPHTDRLSHSNSEQSTATKQIAIRSYATRGRHSDKGHHGKGIQSSSSKKACDLRRSLMLHKQRKHLSSSPRSTARVEAKRHSFTKRGKKSSSEELDKSSSSHSSSEFSSPTKRCNGKRHHDSDEKIKENIESTKRRKQTGHRTSSRTAAARRKSESSRNKESKTTNESSGRSSQKQKRSTREPRHQASVKSSTRRADRLLHDVAATLAEDNISLRKPDLGAVASQEGTEILSDVAVRSEDNKDCVEQDGPLVGSDEDAPIAEETEDGPETEEEASEEEITARVNSSTQLGVSYDVDNFAPDMDNTEESYDSTGVPADNSRNPDSCLASKTTPTSPKSELESPDLSLEDQDFAIIDENATFMADDFEETHKLEVSEIIASKKISETMVVEELEEASFKKDYFHVVDMEFSSEDASPDISLSSKVFCYPGESNYTEKEFVDMGDENCNVEDISFTDTESELHDTEPISCGAAFGHLTDNLKQGAYNVAIKISAVTNNRVNNAGSCLPDTKPGKCIAEVGSLSDNRMNLRGSSMAEHRYANNSARKLGVVKNEESDAFCTEQELSNSSSFCAVIATGKKKQGIDKNPNDELGKSVSVMKGCDFSAQESDVKERDAVKSNSEMQVVRKLGDASSDARCQEKNVVSTEEVTQGESCRDIEGSHVYKLKLGGSKMKGANNKEEAVSIVEGIDNMRKEVFNREGAGCFYKTEEKVHGTEDDIKVKSTAAVVSDTDEGIWCKKEGKIGNKSRNEGRREESVDFGERNHQEEIYGENASDATYNKEGNEDSLNTVATASNSKNGRIDACDTVQDDMFEGETNDKTICSDKVFQDKCTGRDLDYYKSNKDHNCHEGQVPSNKECDCVTQKCFDSPSKVSRDGNGHVTQQKMHTPKKLSTTDLKIKKRGHGTVSSMENVDVNMESCNTEDGYFMREEFFKTAIASDPTFEQKKKRNTEGVRLDAKLEKEDNNKTVDGQENFEQVDMEISSDDEHQHQSLNNSAVGVDDEGRVKYIDSTTPYSPSSPTWKSDGHCSPPPAKDDSSPYSPSHPTNISESDVEHNDPVKELCYDDAECERGQDISKARKEIDSIECNNCLKDSQVGKNERNANITALNRILKSDEGSTSSVRSPGNCTSPNVPNKPYKPGSPRQLPLVKDSVSVDMRARDLIQREENNNEYVQGDCSNSAASVDDSVTDDSNKVTKKPLMSCPRRSQSLPTFTSVVPKPKVVYITATKTKQFRTESGPQNKLLVSYVTNDKTVPNSPTPEEAPGKQWGFAGTSTEPRNSQRPIVSEMELRSFSKASSSVEPLLTERYCSNNATLRQGNEATCDKEVDYRVKEAVNVCSDTHGNESGHLRVCPTNVTGGLRKRRPSNDERNMNKEINNNKNGKISNGMPSTSRTSDTGNDVFPRTSASKISQKSRQKESQHSFSAATANQAQSQIKERPTKCSVSTEDCVPDVNIKSNYGPVRVQVTSEGTVNESLSESEAWTDGSVLEDKMANAEGEVKEDASCATYERLRFQKVYSLPNSSPRIANKRHNTDTLNEALHPCKVSRKPLKLIIPTNHVPGRTSKRTVKPGRKYARNTSSCTITSGDLDFVPGSNGLSVNENKNGMTEDMLVVNDSGNMNGNEMTALSSPSTMTSPLYSQGFKATLRRGLKCIGKTTSSTVIRADLELAPERNSLSLHGHDFSSGEGVKDNEPDDVNSELLVMPSPQSNSTNDTDSIVLSQSDGRSPATINMSPLSEHLARLGQHNRAFPADKNSIVLEEQKAEGVLTDDNANRMGKESDLITSKMERLRKKKEEIEQVYKRECQTVISVVKMLVSKDPRLESVLQNAVRRSLQEMGQRCVQELEKQIRPAT